MNDSESTEPTRFATAITFGALATLGLGMVMIVIALAIDFVRSIYMGDGMAIMVAVMFAVMFAVFLIITAIVYFIDPEVT